MGVYDISPKVTALAEEVEALVVKRPAYPRG